MIKINKERVVITGQNLINGCAASVDNAEALEKILKISDRIIEITKLVSGSVSKSFEALSEKFKSTVFVFDSVKFISSVKTLVCRDKNGKYFLTNIENSIQKRIDRVCLAVHTCFKTIRGMKKIGLVTLGEFAKATVGRLPVLDLVTDTFIALSSFFSTWDTVAYGIPASNKKISTAKAKLNKWKSRGNDIRCLKINDPEAVNAYSSKYLAAKEKIPKEISKLKSFKSLKLDELKSVSSEEGHVEYLIEIKKIDSDIAKLEKKLERIEKRVAWIESKDFFSLAVDLESQKIKGYGGKIHQWTIIEKNQHIGQKKNILKVANAVGKIGIVTTALTLTGIYGGVWGFGIALTMLVLGNILDSIGLTKILYEEFAKEKPIPKPV